MNVVHTDPEHPSNEVLAEVAEAVLRGGVVAFPTDTVYGLSCSLFDVAAVEMLARLKRRDPSHAVISLIPESQQVYALAEDIDEVAERLIAKHWPGPLSLIFRASPLVPARVRGAAGTIALRCPRDTLCHAILHAIGGPVVSSSANLSGQPPARSAEEVLRIFGNQLDLVVDGGPRLEDRPSTLVDVSGPRPRLLRRGALDVDADLGAFDDATGDRATS